MRYLVAAFALIGGLAAMPQPASANSFRANTPTLPILYRYAACIFRTDAPSAAQQIENCAPLRATLEEEAENVLDEFFRGRQRAERRELLRSLDWLEDEAVDIEERGLEVPSVVLDYVDCMGSRVMATDQYRSGLSIDYLSIWKPCREQSGIAEAAESDNDIKYLFDGFESRGRLVVAPHRPWPEVNGNFGLFDYRRLPEAGGEAASYGGGR